MAECILQLCRAAEGPSESDVCSPQTSVQKSAEELPQSKSPPVRVRASDADAKVRDSFCLLFANSPFLASWGAFWGAPSGAPEASSPMQCPARG